LAKHFIRKRQSARRPGRRRLDVEESGIGVVEEVVQRGSGEFEDVVTAIWPFRRS
jgi:hypothetical protein